MTESQIVVIHYTEIERDGEKIMPILSLVQSAGF